MFIYTIKLNINYIKYSIHSFSTSAINNNNNSSTNLNLNNSPNYNKMDPFFITGLVDADGTFAVSIARSPSHLIG
jgi:hypothetical protein